MYKYSIVYIHILYIYIFIYSYPANKNKLNTHCSILYINDISSILSTKMYISSRMWLPFSLRFKLRILSIIHKSIYSFTPSYISDLIKKRTILSSLRYQNAPLLISQNSSKTSLNSRAFKNSGLTLWNSLPPTIRSIRSHKRFT